MVGPELPDVLALALALALAGIVISRSGTGTAKLTALGKPSVLGPLAPSDAPIPRSA